MKLISKWEEGDLDLYVISHPLMGNLTYRKNLYFTIYHLQHYKKQIDAVAKIKK